MKKKNVIAYDNLPTRCPLASAALTALILDRAKAPGWLWGACGVLFAITLLAWGIATMQERYVDVLKDMEGGK